MIRRTATAVTVTCDMDGCDEELSTPARPPHRLGSLPPQDVWFTAYDQGWRNRATADGYGVTRAIDVCPFHATRPTYL